MQSSECSSNVLLLKLVKGHNVIWNVFVFPNQAVMQPDMSGRGDLTMIVTNRRKMEQHFLSEADLKHLDFKDSANFET